MKTISITDPNVVEQIRAVMNTVTAEKKGLMPASYLNIFNRKDIAIEPYGTITIGKALGLCILNNRYISDGKATIYVVGLTTAEKLIGAGFEIELLKNDGILSIKSKYGTPAGFTVVYQNLPI